MLRLLTFPLNISVTFTISLILCSFHLSNFYETPNQNEMLYVLSIILFFICSSIFIPYKHYYNKKQYNNEEAWKFFFYFSLSGFLVEFLLFGIPAFSPGGREDYKGIPIAHVAFYASSIICVLMASVYSTKKTIALCLFYSLCISALLMSRQMIMITFPIVFISILTRHRLNSLHWIMMIAGFIMLLIIFVILGNIRQQLAGDYFDNYIITVGGANESGQSMGQAAYWIWLYIASPIYNLILNFNDYYNFGSLCNYNVTYGSCDGDFLSSSVAPEIFLKYTIGNEFIEDLQISYLNVSTGFAKSARILGVTGVILQCILSLFFYFAGTLLTPKRYREAFRVYFSVLSLYMCFDNKFIRTEFFFGFILIILAPKIINLLIPKHHLDRN